MQTTEPVSLTFIGPHGAGKTTLGRHVAAAFGWSFLPEIGAELRRHALAADPSAHALRNQESFDDEVIRRELLRGRVQSDSYVVETGHPGNLAYAESRSPQSFLRWERIVCRTGPRFRFVQPLVMSPATAIARLSEPGPDPVELIRFFAQVGNRAAELARRWGWLVLPPLETDTRRPVELAAVVRQRLHAALGRSGILALPDDRAIRQRAVRDAALRSVSKLR
jgi:hypothetical protein